MSGLFKKPASNDTYIVGLKGSRLHGHETPFGCGVITDQTIPEGEAGRHVATFNRFNREVDKLLAQFPVFDQKK